MTDAPAPNDPIVLIDAGDGRRLERFGDRVVDRPAPAAAAPPRDPGAWRAADLRFDRERGWSGRRAGEGPWTVEIDRLRLELRATDAGQVGVFPEQRSTWAWLRERLDPSDAAEVLNLFASTGAASLIAAAAGARVVHVDASRPTVAWARRNAALSGLEDRPIRWLVDDAEAFLRREARRGRRYDGIVLDPPSWGHAPGGRSWRLEERLEPLLELVAAVAAPGAFVALSAHTPGLDQRTLGDALGAAAHATSTARIETGELLLEAESGARLPLGSWARMMLR